MAAQHSSDLLLAPGEPSLRNEARAFVVGENPESPGMRALPSRIRRSRRVQALLAGAGP